jgi:hypothetical protein
MIAVAIAAAFLYTLPNFFGESPAVQVSSARATVKIDPALMQTVQDALKKADIPYRGAVFDPGGIRVRFDDTDTQLKAKDLIHSTLNPGAAPQATPEDDPKVNYVVALNLLPASPGWLTAIRALPMYLGLDLRGGVHFLLQLDMVGATTKRLESVAADIRSQLREKNVRHGGVTREGQTLRVRFRDAEMRNRARDAITANLPDLTVTEREDGQDLLLIATLKPDAVKRNQEYALKQNITTLHNRINELGVAEPIIQQQGSDRIVVQLPGVQDVARAKRLIGRTATLEIRMVAEEHMNPEALANAAKGQVPFGTEFYVERNGQPLLVRRQVVLTGDRLTDAQPGFDSQTNEPAVHLRLDGQGARIFQEVTRENVNKRMAILLIEKGKGEVITAPDLRPHEHDRGERRRAPPARGVARRADGDHRGAHRRPKPRAREHREGLQRDQVGLHRDRPLHVGVLRALWRDLVDRARGERAALDRAALAPAGDADPARHRGDRAYSRHGDRRQRADQRARARGAAQRPNAAGGDPRRLRARLGDDPRLQRHDLHCRRVAPDGARRRARLRGRALPRHPDLDVLRGRRVARHRESRVWTPPPRRPPLDRRHRMEMTMKNRGQTRILPAWGLTPIFRAR